MLALVGGGDGRGGVGTAHADEGLWTFDNPPQRQLVERYQLNPSGDLLRNLQRASVRVGEGGSGVLVGDGGLLLTNHHVARDQIHKLSTPTRDLLRDGYYAATPGDELRCPDMVVSLLWSLEEVTARVRAAVPDTLGAVEASARRKEVFSAIEAESLARTGLRSEVVTLYGGGEFWLYRYRRYTDVRLVFAPEGQAAEFGGEYDNFTYPRYALDFSILRVYENGRPLRPEHFLRLRKQPVRDGEVVLVAGHPGLTSRGLTVAQLRYHRDVQNPIQLALLKARAAMLVRYAELGPEQARQASALRLHVENQLKRLLGQQAGLLEGSGLKKKQTEEDELRNLVGRDPKLRVSYGDAWEKLAAAYRGLPPIAKRIAYTALPYGSLPALALLLYRYPEETRKPNGERFEEFRDSRLDSLRIHLTSKAPRYLELEEAVLADWLTQVQAALGPRDPFVRAALGEPALSPADAARQAIAKTRLHDPAVRRELLDGGAEAMARSQDPLLLLLKRLDPVLRDVRTLNEQRVTSVDLVQGRRIAEARFAVYGRTTYPDASSTLRLGFGSVRGYEKDTRLVPPHTTFFGLFDRALGFEERPPYDLPPRIRRARSLIDLSTPLDFVYTADTIGGNSGSPVVDRHGDVVGLNFDSNLEKLPNRYFYVDETLGSRAVAVHTGAILEVLRKVYEAASLADELVATPRPTAAAPSPARPNP